MIDVVEGDITRLAVDAIVNAANESLLGGGGVDGAIHRAAGSELRAYTSRVGGCPTGEVRVSPGFALPAKWIIHTVGPVWRGGGCGEARLLEQCYRNVFDAARRLGVQSISLPAISTGAYGYPRREAAQIALAAMGDNEMHFERIIACCIDTRTAAVYRQLLESSPQQ